jgi:hypothetical protein
LQAHHAQQAVRRKAVKRYWDRVEPEPAGGAGGAGAGVPHERHTGDWFCVPKVVAWARVTSQKIFLIDTGSNRSLRT